MPNTNTSIQKKIDHISAHFPEVMALDPFQNRALVVRIKDSLYEAGFYATRSRYNDPNTDKAIIRLIQKVKGNRIKPRASESHRRAK